MKNNILDSEFTEFINGESAWPPQSVKDVIFEKIKRDLNPTGLTVFKKFIAIELISGLVTLLFCPQFGFGGLVGNVGFSHLLMKFGETACMAGCGAIFLGVGSLVAAFLLSPEELKVLKKNWLVQFSTVALLAIVVFTCLGAPVLPAVDIAWFFGSVAGGLVAVNLGQRIRIAAVSG